MSGSLARVLYIYPKSKKAAIRQYPALIKLMLPTPNAGIRSKLIPQKNSPNP